MSIRQLQYSKALFDECHFGTAAECCHVTQSTLSVQIACLEGFPGARLFSRNSRNVVPTAVAHAIAPTVQAVLDGLDEIRCTVDRAASQGIT